jgi:hypothetical protein
MYGQQSEICPLCLQVDEEMRTLLVNLKELASC